MSKIMPLDELSSIKGAKASKAVSDLFDIIKKTDVKKNNATLQKNASIDIEDLREDTVVKTSVETKKMIKENFPSEKQGYLVVSKVIP